MVEIFRGGSQLKSCLLTQLLCALLSLLLFYYTQISVHHFQSQPKGTPFLSSITMTMSMVGEGKLRGIFIFSGFSVIVNIFAINCYFFSFV